MKIIVDAMGGDNAPGAVVAGSVEALSKYGVEIILVGRVEDILRALHEAGEREVPRGIEIMPADDVIDMHDDPVAAIRTKRGASMVVALEALKNGTGQAVVSAGSTGALLTGATLIVKRVRGIRRAAVAPIIPSKSGGAVVIDSGANLDCTAEQLLQFAYMGAYYAEDELGIANPRVGLLNNGAEETKGGKLQLETYALLQKAGAEGRLNFVGNVEARDPITGGCDVVVCDGFSGNILIKASEGVVSFLFSELREVFAKNILTKLAAALVRFGLKKLRAKANPDTVGGVIMLGISKPVIKAHGSSGAGAISSAIGKAKRAAESRVAEKLQENIDSLKLEDEK
ncbi:MAG: phosphate acyltransferase PlsX [Oscillospiraceae bacterium]|jgi:glycerol-3-phosphate acyltransferase PlsX|nr:phosphate acyltransferase PlsX [Oscillospiraceae bacterium]